MNRLSHMPQGPFTTFQRRFVTLREALPHPDPRANRVGSSAFQHPSEPRDEPAIVNPEGLPVPSRPCDARTSGPSAKALRGNPFPSRAASSSVIQRSEACDYAIRPATTTDPAHEDAQELRELSEWELVQLPRQREWQIVGCGSPLDSSRLPPLRFPPALGGPEGGAPPAEGARGAAAAPVGGSASTRADTMLPRDATSLQVTISRRLMTQTLLVQVGGRVVRHDPTASRSRTTTASPGAYRNASHSETRGAPQCWHRPPSVPAT